eukprot:1191333-Prorocentrum_minimum.AAC.3
MASRGGFVALGGSLVKRRRPKGRQHRLQTANQVIHLRHQGFLQPKSPEDQGVQYVRKGGTRFASLHRLPTTATCAALVLLRCLTSVSYFGVLLQWLTRTHLPHGWPLRRDRPCSPLRQQLLRGGPSRRGAGPGWPGLARPHAGNPTTAVGCCTKLRSARPKRLTGRFDRAASRLLVSALGAGGGRLGVGVGHVSGLGGGWRHCRHGRRVLLVRHVLPFQGAALESVRALCFGGFRREVWVEGDRLKVGGSRA